MRKKFNLFLFKHWPWAYYKFRSFRIWFYGFQEDFGRKYDAEYEPLAFACSISKPIKKKKKVVKFYDSPEVKNRNEQVATRFTGDFHESEQVFHD